MRRYRRPHCALLALAACALAAFAPSAPALTATSFDIVVGETSTPVEMNVARLLADRLSERTGVKVVVRPETARPTGAPRILLGIPAHHKSIAALFEQYRIPPLTDLAPGPEGYLVRTVETAGGPAILAAGIDRRGCLYAAGELLRQATFDAGSVTFPDDLHVRTAPAFEVRGTQVGQSHIAKSVAQVRDWTEAELHRAILDYALAGANVFDCGPGPMYDFLKSFDLMALGGFGANTGLPSDKPEWEAKESIGRTGYVCLSVPEARAYMIEKCENEFKNAPAYDFIKFHGGDGGGCECDLCHPYGLIFIQTVEEMAKRIHQHHPDTRIYFTNQKFQNADDNAVFDYLNEAPRDWLWAWGYGPGSDAASWQPGHRQTHRMDLFRYPGYGPYGLYPKEILHQMPKRHALVYYNEITHWKYAQHAYIQMYPRADRNGDLPPHWSHEIYERRPDQFLTMVYNRLSFYAWPRFYYRVFHDLMPYGVGDITHSSGHHDHFNQWMWMRLLVDPRLTVDEVVGEYCRTWFGPEAAEDMAAALYLLERNMEEIPGEPLPEKASVGEYYERVKAAGEKMPAHWMKNNWLWREYMQKGALDRYTQMNARQQVALQSRIEAHIADALASGGEDVAIPEALGWFSGLGETLEMRALREEAERLGAESNELYGVRNDGLFTLDHDFIGLGWLKRQLERAHAAEGEERADLLRMITAYEDPGPGGHYDNLGTANPAPNVMAGYPYDHGQPYVHGMLDEGNRPSQRSMHFTQDEDQGVTLEYRDLDPAAAYQIRFTLVRPWYQERYAMRMNQKSQSIFADGVKIADNIELPPQMSDFFTFDIPAEATRDGKLTIHFERAPDVARGDRVTVEQWRNSGGWGTICSEAWLLKKE
ncbi:MAG: hypothetical protein KF886_08100 [Candidatus Hydrogenedentes bacterium]|nr:hypothetical protein [Candidatus Hydrogenedentota bacterium]